MSSSPRQTLTEDRLRLLGQEVDEIKADLRLALSAPATTPGYQMLAGSPVFPNGFMVGAQVLYEPHTLPSVTGVHATWSASFDVISIDVSWSAPTGLGADQIVTYVVQAQKQGSTSPPIEVSTNQTTAHIEPVEPNTTYVISVSAQSKLGRLASPGTTTITTGGDTTPPAAPTFPASNAVLPAINALAIKWNPNTERDVANGAGQYRVVVSTSSSLASPAYDGKVNGTNLFASPLVGGTAYYVGVYAIDSSGNQSAVGKPTGGPWTALSNVTDTSALAIGGGNIIKNSGFENYFFGQVGYDATSFAWLLATNGATIAKDTTNSHGAFGRGSAQISGTGDAWIYQDLTLAAGTWIVSCWTKATSVAGPGRGVVLNIDPQSGTVVNGSVVMNGTAGSQTWDAVVGQGTWDWKRTAVKFDVTSASAVVRVVLQRGYFGSCTGQAWFDEVQVEQGNVITAYAPRADEILQDTIISTQITNDAITSPKIIAGAIVAGKIAAGAVGAVEIAARSIQAGNIATDTLTANEIAAGAITANELAANSVTAAAIQANSITSAQIAANTITTSNLSVTLGLAVGQFIQSSNYVSATTGWRIDGNGNAELQNATVRNGAFIGGQINIAGRIYADPGDTSVHLAANVEIGAGYSGTLYSGDLNWGFQIGHDPSVGTTRWVDVMGSLTNGLNTRCSFYDKNRNRPLFLVDGNADAYKPGPDGYLYSEKLNQYGAWSNVAIVSASGSSIIGGSGDASGTGYAFNAQGVAAIWKLNAFDGSVIQARDQGDGTFIPVWASSFVVSSSQTTKDEIASLTDSSPLTSLRPVSFVRKAKTVCAYCNDTGNVVVRAFSPKALTHVQVGENCPVCQDGETVRGATAIANEDATRFGLIAEEVAEVVPEAVAWSVDAEGNKVARGLDYSVLTALTIAHLQNLEARLAAIEAQ